MSAPIFRNTVLRNVAHNKRFYSTSPPTGQAPGKYNYYLLGMIASGAGYYLYKKSRESGKGPMENVGETIDAKVEEAKKNASDKLEETKSKLEQRKIDASNTVSEKVNEAKDKYTDVKSEAVQMGEDIQKSIGDKISDAGKSLKDNA